MNAHLNRLGDVIPMGICGIMFDRCCETYYSNINRTPFVLPLRHLLYTVEGIDIKSNSYESLSNRISGENLIVHHSCLILQSIVFWAGGLLLQIKELHCIVLYCICKESSECP